MKYIVSQLTHFLAEPEARKNVGQLLKYLLLVLGVMIVYSIGFHFIMSTVEGQEHSWLTGFYWTLTVMSTLGFGDITFHSDIGRLFSMLVLITGIVLLLIMLPFAFIRYFYGPWLEAQIRLDVPRSVPARTEDHVIICRFDSIAPGVIRKLVFDRIPYFVVEPDLAVATRLTNENIAVIHGEIDNRETYAQLRVSSARLVLANAEDPTNSCVALTIREAAPDVPIVALAEQEESVDILQLSGASYVLPLKHRLGEHLAARVKAGESRVQITGRFRDLCIGEFLAHDTFLVGKTLKEARLRQRTGVNVVSVREGVVLQPVSGDLVFSEHSIPVVIGTADQLKTLANLLGAQDNRDRPVLVIGGGKVGLAAANALEQRGVSVCIVEKQADALRHLRQAGHKVVVGDAADRTVLFEAGLEEASAVVLTTNDDATNIYLTVYCRRLKPEVNIVSRLTLERNVEAIYRAGADSVLSYASLGREQVMAVLHGRDPILMGEGADTFLAEVPAGLVGKTLQESNLGTQTGLIVVAVESGESTITNPPPSLILEAGSQLLMLGTPAQRQAFSKVFD